MKFLGARGSILGRLAGIAVLGAGAGWVSEGLVPEADQLQIAYRGTSIKFFG